MSDRGERAGTSRPSVPRRAPARRGNRRLGPPVWRRLPGPRALGRAGLRGLRAALPVLGVLAAIATVATGVGFGYRWMMGSPRFAVAEIDIHGNRVVTDDEIRDLLAIGSDDNIFRVDLRALEERLESNPWIRGASVDRRLPDRLEVAVVEETAVALVDLGGLYLASADGRPFKRAAIAQGEGTGLPVITGLRRADYLRTPEAVAARVREALQLAALYAAGSGRPAIAEIQFHPGHGVVLHTRESAMAIRVGHAAPEEAAVRLAAFDAAWAALADDERARARVVYLDNRTRPDRITVGFETAKAN